MKIPKKLKAEWKQMDTNAQSIGVNPYGHSQGNRNRFIYQPVYGRRFILIDFVKPFTLSSMSKQLSQKIFDQYNDLKDFQGMFFKQWQRYEKHKKQFDSKGNLIEPLKYKGL